jgi:NADPH2:quinone reductase
MLASTLTAENTYELSEHPDPKPGAGEVLVRVAYAGVQWGDVLLRDGHFPAPRPFVGGFEASGTIEAVGDGVDPSRVGEPVAALTTAGAFAELVTVPAALAIPAGDLDLRVAGGFGWVTPAAFDLIARIGQVERGDRVLVHAAAGGVGTLAVQFARAAYAATIVGVVATEGQMDYARRFGLDDVVTQHEFPQALDGQSFDVILDPIGGRTREHNLEILAAHGRLVVYGNIASWDSVMISTNDLLMGGKSVLTSVRAGSVRPDITAEYPLEDVATAVDRLARGGTQGKSIVRISRT